MVDSAAVVQGQGECYDDGVYGKSLCLEVIDITMEDGAPIYPNQRVIR